MSSVRAYLRVSSRSQDAASQRSAIERAAAARGDAIVHWYSEKRSAKTTDRAELRQLRDDARAGHIRRLYIFRLDRLTRSGIQDTLQVIGELRSHGVELVTVSDGFDLDGPAAEVVLAVMAWASKMERLALAERVAAARERVEAEGGKWGRPRRMDPALVARARAMQAEGRSVREISMALRTPRATVGRALRASQKGCTDREPQSSTDPTSEPPAS